VGRDTLLGHKGDVIVEQGLGSQMVLISHKLIFVGLFVVIRHVNLLVLVKTT
jgi:hypothetical protein